MHLPRNPPDIDSILSDGQKSKDVLSEEIKGYAKDFNRKYLHWSEVRFREPGPFDTDTVWTSMKLVRIDRGLTHAFGAHN